MAADEFVPLRKKLKRASTREEDNFVPSYAPPSLLAAQDQEEAAGLRWRHGIRVQSSCGGRAPDQHTSTAEGVPLLANFSQLQLSSALMAALSNMNYSTPTPVQMQTIPCALAGRDLIVLAETGSGKTLAYTLPLCVLLSTLEPLQAGGNPRALVLAPTRELAQQVHSYVQYFLSLVRCSCAITHLHKQTYSALLVCGGVPLSSLDVGAADVLVATPGKLLKLAENRTDLLSSLLYIVVDEADRFMSGHLEEQLREVFSKATASLRPHQMLLFSATLPSDLQQLARSAVLNPLMVSVGEAGVTPASLSQDLVFVHTYQKPKVLLETLRKTESPPVLVFCNSIQTVDEVESLLHREQFHVAALHSDKLQGKRFKTLESFKAGGVDVMVATDLASRGLDIPGISCVVNYDLPHSIEDYIHRCGRAARLSQSGKAVSLLTLECRIAKELKELLVSLDQPVPQELEDTRQFGRRVVTTELGDRPLVLS